jgi:GntR family transcriptional regulator/MocR family aminotransferase
MHRLALGLSAIVRLDRTIGVPLSRQLLDSLRDAILTGRLRPGTRFPSTRALSSELGISRNIVLTVFEQLTDEGYLRGRVGSGTYVREDLPETFLRASRPARGPATTAQAPRRVGSKARAITDSMSAYTDSIMNTSRPFHGGLPALDAFPYQLWMRLTAQVWRRLRPRDFAYGDSQGYQPLREVIAEYLEANRGVRCTADQIIVVSGSQQGLDLVARVLLNPGDAVWVEDPGYIIARAALLNAGARLVPVPVDAEGLKVEIGFARAARARMALVTPSHQLPLGMIMTLPRRMALLDWARRAGAWVVEDDYNSEFRYGGPPLPSLQGVDVTQRVIYMGTFSKTLLPALRIGYLVIPPDLVRLFSIARRALDLHRPLLEQAVLAEFIAEGHYARHLRRMRLLYERRQRALVSAVSDELRGIVEIAPADAGMHLIGWLPPGTSDRQAAEHALRHDCVMRPLSWFTLEHCLRPGLVLGYAAFSEDEIGNGVRRLGVALRESIGGLRPSGRAPST